METRISDQLEESKYRDVARAVLHSGNLYGTGILKGPLVERRSRVCYAWNNEKKKFEQSEKKFRRAVPVARSHWRFYPDMGVTKLDDARYVWEHHRLYVTSWRAGFRKTFNCELIRTHINTNPFGDIPESVTTSSNCAHWANRSSF